MYLMREKSTGKAMSWWEKDYPVLAAGEPMHAPLPPEGCEVVNIDGDCVAFEAAAREDAGITEGEPLGEVYVEDEPPAGSQAFGSPRGPFQGKQGKRVGHGEPKRVFAYAPSNPVTELMQELGKNSRQSVSWGEVERIVEMIRGER